jgi:hypothetical protein
MWVERRLLSVALYAPASGDARSPKGGGASPAAQWTRTGQDRALRLVIQSGHRHRWITKHATLDDQTRPTRLRVRAHCTDFERSASVGRPPSGAFTAPSRDGLWAIPHHVIAGIRVLKTLSPSVKLLQDFCSASSVRGHDLTVARVRKSAPKRSSAQTKRSGAWAGLWSGIAGYCLRLRLAAGPARPRPNRASVPGPPTGRGKKYQTPDQDGWLAHVLHRVKRGNAGLCCIPPSVFSSLHHNWSVTWTSSFRAQLLIMKLPRRQVLVVGSILPQCSRSLAHFRGRHRCANVQRGTAWLRSNPGGAK